MAPLPRRFAIWIDGRELPKLIAYKCADGRVSMTLDNRIGGEFVDDIQASQAAWLIGNAMAIGAGFPSVRGSDFEQKRATEGVNIFAREIPWPLTEVPPLDDAQNAVRVAREATEKE